MVCGAGQYPLAHGPTPVRDPVVGDPWCNIGFNHQAYVNYDRKKCRITSFDLYVFINKVPRGIRTQSRGAAGGHSIPSGRLELQQPDFLARTAVHMVGGADRADSSLGSNILSTCVASLPPLSLTTPLPPHPPRRISRAQSSPMRFKRPVHRTESGEATCNPSGRRILLRRLFEKLLPLRPGVPSRAGRLPGVAVSGRRRGRRWNCGT